MKKVTIFIPTYNDAEYIERTLLSVVNQIYDNWEVLICDDGSSDDTKNVVSKFVKKYKLSSKIKYYYEDNADQLNAIINLLQYATGDYAYILHSDDLLASNNILDKAVKYMNNNKYEGIITDLDVIDNDDKLISIFKCKDYKYSKSRVVLQLLNLGKNIYNDFPFCNMKVFKKQILNNYLIWNRPFWINDDMTMLNIKHVDFNIRKYRVNGENYLDTPGANFNVFNGEVRTFCKMLHYFNIPFYKEQYYLSRIVYRFGIMYKPIYFNKESKNLYKTLYFVMKKTFNDEEINSNIFLNSLLMFFKNIKNKRVVELDKLDKNLFIYYGKDMRRFNKMIKNETLEKFYYIFLNEMKAGFNKLIVYEEDYDKICNICKFMCIYDYIKIEKR